LLRSPVPRLARFWRVEKSQLGEETFDPLLACRTRFIGARADGPIHKCPAGAPYRPPYRPAWSRDWRGRAIPGSRADRRRGPEDAWRRNGEARGGLRFLAGRALTSAVPRRAG